MRVASIRLGMCTVSQQKTQAGCNIFLSTAPVQAVNYLVSVILQHACVRISSVASKQAHVMCTAVGDARDSASQAHHCKHSAPGDQALWPEPVSGSRRQGAAGGTLKHIAEGEKREI